jgi:signal transduction histidine kinase
MNMPDSALKNLELSYKIFETVKEELFGNSYSVYPTWYNLRAKVYFQQDKTAEGLQDLFTGLELTKMSNEPYHISNFCNDLSLYFKNTNQLDSSIFYAEEGLAAANKISYTQGIHAASKLLAEQYEGIDAEIAFYYYKLATQTQSQLYGAGNMQIMRDMIAQEEKRLQDIEVAKVEFQNRLRMNALLGSTFTLIVIAFFLFRNGRNKQKAKQKVEEAYDQLKSTQAQLIHSEKMASLGELTAGIAHEIQNPLNFVNNFSDVNAELTEELREEVKKGNLKEIDALAKDIEENEKKIIHHGKRAEEIVKSMLQHSRGSEGIIELTDINALADEYLRLAYHGFRAKDKSFNADFKTELDDSIPKIEVVPQDIGRVFLNLINNAFFAVSERKNIATGDYQPLVKLTTTVAPPLRGDKGGVVVITISDNGPGIPEDIKDKIFQPFFTTKSSGQGTGLGLSLSYDIITKGHGGTIEVKSEEGTGTEFLINLPA